MTTTTPSIRSLAAAAALVCAALFASAAPAQTAQDGKSAYAVCAGCHSVDGSPKPTGPTLKGVFGAKAATVDKRYARYSTALRDSRITWTAQELDAYLKAPTARVKGTTMTIGVADDRRRKAIVAYLRTLK